MAKRIKTRTNLYIREDQLRRLKAVGAVRASSTAELVRQAIDDYLEKLEAKALKKGKRSQ